MFMKKLMGHGKEQGRGEDHKREITILEPECNSGYYEEIADANSMIEIEKEAQSMLDLLV